MPVSKGDLQVYQGDDYGAQVKVMLIDRTPADLAGWVPRAQVRRGPADYEEIVAVITTTLALPDRVLLHMPSSVTRPLEGRYRWDLDLINDAGQVLTIMAGAVIVTSEITREGAAPPAPSQQLTITDEGVALPQRAILNFTGAGVTVTDDPANGRTIVTIPGGGSGGGSQTPWAQDIDAAGNDLLNAGAVNAQTLGALGSVSVGTELHISNSGTPATFRLDAASDVLHIIGSTPILSLEALTALTELGGPLKFSNGTIQTTAYTALAAAEEIIERLEADANLRARLKALLAAT